MDDIDLHQNTLFNRNLEDMLKSRLFSEVEGSLRIENVPTTHKRIVEISKQESLTDKNDIIIKNMLNAMEFIIVEKPAFNKDNLKKLYQILCNNCLADDLCLKEDAYYRDDAVYIDKYEGADWHIVEECMDSMFAFANNEDNIKKHGVFLPYICHYYILYVHPYFDYNGRTARMVSFWLNYINDIPVAPYFISEAINESKGDYYSALVNTRDTNNDLTYFLGYILETSIRYSFVYKNLEEIRKELSKAGDSLSSGEWVYVKKILIHNPENYFNYKEFLGYINATMTRQGALKILNNVTEYGILEKTQNRKGDTIFRLNPDCVTYQYHS
jgi:Fic family protein